MFEEMVEGKVHRKLLYRKLQKLDDYGDRNGKNPMWEKSLG